MAFIPNRWNGSFSGIPRNAWFGTSVEDQAAANARIPHLLRVPAAVRFLSCEPLLGPVDLARIPVEGGAVCALRGARPAYPSVDWVIVGGESGHGARPMHPDWARSLRDQCQAAGVAFLFKQWGEYWPAGRSIVEGKDMVLFGDEPMYRVGKHVAGRMLDGRTWDEYPVVAEVVR
jgi:protein gp37